MPVSTRHCTDLSSGGRSCDGRFTADGLQFWASLAVLAPVQCARVFLEPEAIMIRPGGDFQRPGGRTLPGQRGRAAADGSFSLSLPRTNRICSQTDGCDQRIDAFGLANRATSLSLS